MNALFAQAVVDGEADSSINHRRSAALLLHGMDATDRAWALSKLSAGERAALQPLLEELKGMGVPADSSWVREVLNHAGQAYSRDTPGGADAARRDVALADAERVVELLLAEPSSLVRRVFALGPWPWSAVVLSKLRNHRAELIGAEPAFAACSLPSALDEAILLQVAKQLNGNRRDAVERPSDRLPGFKLWARLRTWGAAR